MLDIFFSYGWELVLIHRILIGFEWIWEIILKTICRSGILVAGGFCHGNPDFDECDLLRLDSTMFYDWQNGKIPYHEQEQYNLLLWLIIKF